MKGLIFLENNEQLERARNANLAEYFKAAGYETEQIRNELHVKNFGGLYVNLNDNSWFCFSANKGGNNAVNCLTEIVGMDFKTAVEELSGQRFERRSRENPQKNVSVNKELELPERADNMKMVFAYLCKTRGISSEIVSQLAHDILLYQDKKGNAVFLHKDKNGKIIGAEIQGTNSQKRFKGVAKGTSDSVFSFQIGEPKKCYVFESAIDLLSFKQLANPEKIQNSVLVSMAGLKPNSLKSIAEKGIKIYSCVDNDEAGRDFEITNGFPSCKKVLIENGVKDFNELLKKVALPREISKEPLQKNAAEKFENEKSPQKKTSHSRR